MYNGVSLGSVTAIDYWTWVTTNGGGLNNSCQAVYIILNISRNNNAIIDDLLFFEPCYQNGTYPTLYSQGPVPNQCGSNFNCVAFNTWQHWNAGIGGWWSLLDSCPPCGGPPLTTLAAYAAQYPSAVIRNAVGPTKGGVRLTAGFGGPLDWGNFDGNTDAFTIGVFGNNTTYNFEPTSGVPQVTGGGRINGLPSGQATFGFNVRQRNSIVTGHLNYRNHTNGAELNCPVTTLSFSGNTATFGNTGGGCTYSVTVEDNGDPGKGQDMFSITSSADTNSGTLTSGNIQIHK